MHQQAEGSTFEAQHQRQGPQSSVQHTNLPVNRPRSKSRVKSELRELEPRILQLAVHNELASLLDYQLQLALLEAQSR